MYNIILTNISENQSLIFRPKRNLMKCFRARAHILEDWEETNGIPSFTAANRSRDRGWMERWSLEPPRKRRRPPTQISLQSFISFDMFPYLNICWPVLLTHPSTQLESHLLPVINPLLLLNPTPHLHTCPSYSRWYFCRTVRHTTGGFPINNAFPAPLISSSVMHAAPRACKSRLWLEFKWHAQVGLYNPPYSSFQVLANKTLLRGEGSVARNEFPSGALTTTIG